MSTDAVTIRQATAHDARDIGRVFDAAVLAGWTYAEDIEAKVPMFDLPHFEDLVHDVDPSDALLVAEVEGAVMGYTYVRTGEGGEVWLLFVHPDAGGAGVGRRLLGAGEQILREAGCPSVFLWTHQENARARHVYRAAGYEADGRTRDEEFRGWAYTEVRMVKVL